MNILGWLLGFCIFGFLAAIPSEIVGLIVMGLTKSLSASFSMAFITFISIMSLIYRAHINNAKDNKQYQERLSFLKNYEIPESVLKSFHVYYPNLTENQTKEIIIGLKYYFKIFTPQNHAQLMHYSTSSASAVMPSKAVDRLWREFILNTNEYRIFCESALGYFLPHYSIRRMTTLQEQRSLGGIWYHSCRDEGLDLMELSVLPLLFSIDSKLNIPNGNFYDLKECIQNWSSVSYSSYGGGGGGCGGGGCGGGGCGGGCGGGG
jgi:uncharacterized membrane protein YgcG